MRSPIAIALLPSALAMAIDKRQDDSPPFVGGCATEDLSPDVWNANTVDDTIRGTPGFGQGAGFPALFINNFNSKITFDCTDLSQDSQCTIPTNFVFLNNPNPNNPDLSGTVCGSFAEPRVGLIGQAWVNIYTHLKNINDAVQPAVDDILNSNYVDDMVEQSTSAPLPIPASVLLKLSSLSLIFIPAPVGPELAAFRSAVPKLKKLAGKVLKNAGKDASNQEESIDEQPQIIKDLLSSVPAWVQSNMKEQNDDVFVNDHSDSTLGDMLLGGGFLTAPPSKDDYQQAITRNLKIFALAQLWSKLGMTLLAGVSTQFECASATAQRIRGTCFEFRYPDGATGVSLATGNIPRSAAGAIAATGLHFDTVVNNALDCRDAGKTFSDADFEGFITSASDDDQAIPQCLFGLPIAGI